MASETPVLTEVERLRASGMTVAIHAAANPDGLAVKSADGQTRSWGELNARANQLARVLRKAGVQPDDGVALIAHNAPEFIETWAACQRIGARLTPVNWHQSASIVGYILENCDAKAVIASARFQDTLTQVGLQQPMVSLRLAFGGELAGFESYDAALAGQDPSNISDPEIGAYMLYTSGTTGRPKGVYRPIRPTVSQLTNTILETAAFRPYEDVALVTGPLYHAAPLALNMITPINAGVGCVLMDKWDAEEALRLIQDERITHTHVVPTMMHRMLQLPSEVRSKYDLSSLRWVLHGAAPCPPHVKREMIEWIGPVLFEYYSSTEGGGVFINSEDWLRKPGSVGRAVSDVSIKIFDDEGTEAAPNVKGTVYIQAPSVGRFNYYKDEEKTGASYRGDFFTLGDMGYFDEDGFLFLTGRSAELIISGGVNIYPVEIDEVLIQHPDVADAAVVGVPHTDWGEEVKAVVELKSGSTPSDELAESILNFAKERLPGFQRPRSVDFVDALPRSAAGKVLRQQVRDPYWQGKKTSI